MPDEISTRQALSVWASAFSSPLRRRAVLGRLGTGMAAVLLGGCASAVPRQSIPPTASRPGATTATPAPTGPRRGGTLRMGISGDLARLDGHLLLGYLVDTLWNVYDRLTSYDERLRPQPMLADSWDMSSDGRQLKISLRRGVQFHTGRELTSDDVRWNFERVKDPKVGTFASRAQVITGYEIVDKNTLVFKTDRPWTEAFDLFEYVNIVDPVTMQGLDALTDPVGTGPFSFGEYAQGDHLRLVRNPNYWRAGLPFVDEMLVKLFRDPQAMVTQLEGGGLDIADGPSVEDTLRLRQDPNVQVLVNQRSGGFWAISPNATRAPTDNRLVRQALNVAIDRRRIEDAVMHGLAEPRVLPWAGSSPAFDSTKNAAYAFDLDKARSLLREAGISQATFDISWQNSSSIPATIAQIYQSDLAKIGISATLKPLEPAVYLDQMQKLTYNGLVISAPLNGHLQPATMMLGPYYGAENNYSGFRSDAYKRLVSAILTETDSSRRATLFAQLNDVYLVEAWVLPVVQNPQRALASRRVNGLHYDMHETLQPAEAWLSD